MQTKGNEDTASDSDISILSPKDIHNYNSGHILPESAENIRRIRDWLQPTPYDVVGGEYRKHLVSHAPGTGDWLTASATYTEWLHGEDHGLLWIKGIPGSGKSVMAARLVDELARSNPDCPVLYFFFRQIIDANHEPQALLRDWIDQVLYYSPPLQKKLMSYIRDGQSPKSVGTGDLWVDLQEAFTGLPGRIFCVADALDEMDQGNDVFLETLGSLGQLIPSKLKLLITSRPVQRIERPLRKVHSLHIRLQETLVDVDISTYVNMMLAKSDIPNSDWKLIQEAVPGRANGLFLYAKLAMDAFLQPEADVNAVLKQLPVDLNALYTGLLRDHARRSGVEPRVQHLILQAVTHATRPLRLLELTDLVKDMNPDEKKRDTKDTKDLIRAACGPLLEILADETVSVIHHSFTEYLKGTTRSNDPSGYPVLSAGSTHAQLALACLHYLQSGCLDNSQDLTSSGHNNGRDAAKVQSRLKNPFLEYAASSWCHHVRESDAAGYSQSEINDQISNFLSMGSKINNWLPIQSYTISGDSIPYLQLTIPAKTGLISYLRVALANDVPANEGLRTSALMQAAQAGHSSVVQELIRSGAPSDQEDSSGLKPLHYAARSNHHETVKVLLEAGVDPLTPKTKNEEWGDSCMPPPQTAGDTALMYACQNGHMETLEVFLPFLKDVEAVHSALSWACGSQRSQMVDLILKHPSIDVNAKTKGTTPLYRVCGNPDASTIKALLLAGADPNVRCIPKSSPGYCVIATNPLDDVSKPNNQGLDCIQHFFYSMSRAYYPSDEKELSTTFSLLVEAGVDIHQCDEQGKTLLHHAVRSPALTKALLEAGANANARDINGETPLHEEDICVESMRLLIEKGQANINDANNDGRAVLLSYLTCYKSSFDSRLSKFLEYGPDCNVTDNQGNNALHIHIKHSHGQVLATIEELLKKGVDVNLKNNQGLTPLMCARGVPENEILDRLLRAGAHINSVDNNGAGLLFRHISSDKKDWVRLIERGASISARAFSGRSLLHEVIKSQHNWDKCVKSIMYLIELGLDPKVVDNNGNNILHELALNSDDSRKIEIIGKLWERLVHVGLDLDEKNHAGHTPLHILCASSPIRAYDGKDNRHVDFILSQMKNIDVGDSNGATPLHMASASGEDMYTRKLLDAGADPSLATNEGLTPLHIAARCRSSNNVGRLIDALRLKGESGTSTDASQYAQSAGKLKPVMGIDAKTSKQGQHYTPLFYACRSGSPETVELLLDAGATVNLEQVFKATLEFEDECSLWGSSSHPATGDHIPVKLKDKGRPPVFSGGRGYFYELNEERTARLNEVLDMVLSHLAEIPAKVAEAFNYTLLKASLANQDYVASTLLQLQDKWPDKILKEKRDDSTIMKMVKGTHCSRRSGDVENLRSSELIESGKTNEGQMIYFLARREYHLVEEMLSLGSSFLPVPGASDENCLALLVANGYTALFEKLGDLVATSDLGRSLWHAYGDETKPGLWFGAKDVSGSGDRGNNPMPLILTAVRRVKPNMTILRLLVEKFKVHIDEMHYSRETVNEETKLVPTDSALHHLAQRFSWWHTRHALPYLIKAGADPNLRNYKGQTPLHLAVKTLNREAAVMLVEAGADVNAVDNEKKSCLMYAQGDTKLSRILRSHGAATSVGELFAAIENSDVETLKDILSRDEEGINANARRTRLSAEQARKANRKYRGRRYHEDSDSGEEEDRDIVPHDQIYPLFHAAVPDSRRGNVDELVRVLLDFGADPFAKFLARVWPIKARARDSTRDTPSIEVPQGYRECTVLHEIFMRRYGRFQGFVHLPSLDTNHRDYKGRTLLHLACLVADGPDQVVKSQEDGAGLSSETSLFRRLVNLGADMKAQDNHGRNILHYMIRNIRGGSVENSFSDAVASCPELMHNADDDGNTPLLTALAYAANRRETQLAKILLSAGADVQVVNKAGDGALHKLAENLDTEDLRHLFKGLVTRGAPINALNSAGETPLYAFSRRPKTSSTAEYFKRRGFSEKDAIPLLKSLGADFTITNSRGQGLLHASAIGSVDRFSELMEAGADAMLEDGAQLTALDVAAACGNQSVLALFEKKKL